MIAIQALALHYHLAIPLKSEGLERAPNAVCGPWQRPRPVDIFNAQQPFTTVGRASR
jgi:hypothetical protein